MGLGGPLIDFDAFRPKGRGFESRSMDLGQEVLHSQLFVALRREIPTQYSCCVGSASGSSGPKKAR